MQLFWIRNRAGSHGAPERALGRRFGWLWFAYAVSAYGTGFGFGALAYIAILVLHAGPGQVSLLAGAGLAVGAVVAVPLGPWVEFRRKRPVMIAMDVIRLVALVSIPVAHVLHALTFVQLVIVSVVTAAARLTFNAASGAHLKALVPSEGLLVAHGRFEATTWSAMSVGPPLGGAAIGLFGPMTTVLVDAASFLFSALGIRAIGGQEPRPEPVAAGRRRLPDLAEGWRHILGDPVLRPLFFNAVLVNGLIMAAEPSLAVLMLDDLDFRPWQYGLAFAAPCVGGLIGSRLAPRLVARFGVHAILRSAGALRACWPVGLALVVSGVGGLLVVIVVEFGLIVCCSVFNPVLATVRLRSTPSDLAARTLSAWSISSSASIAMLTALWGGLAVVAGPRAAIAIAGVLLLATPILLRRAKATDDTPGRTAVSALRSRRDVGTGGRSVQQQAVRDAEA
jgi:hypothetical protein